MVEKLEFKLLEGFPGHSDKLEFHITTNIFFMYVAWNMHILKNKKMKQNCSLWYLDLPGNPVSLFAKSGILYLESLRHILCL